MISSPSIELRVGHMLPDIEVPVAGEALAMPLRSTRGETTVVFWPHADECDRCDRLRSAMADIADEFRAWDARLLIVARETGTARLRLEGAGLIVADRYGQVFYAVHADAGHEFPSMSELVEWLKYLGTLCPE